MRIFVGIILFVCMMMMVLIGSIIYADMPPKCDWDEINTKHNKKYDER